MKDKKFLIELIVALVLMVAVAVVGAVVESKRPVSGAAQEIKTSVTSVDGNGKTIPNNSAKEADIEPNEAIELVSSLSAEQLGLKDKDKYVGEHKDKDKGFMMNNTAFSIGKEKYLQVIAAKKTENKDGTVSIEPVAKYYVSFDGSKILKENPDVKDEYIEIKK